MIEQMLETMFAGHKEKFIRFEFFLKILSGFVERLLGVLYLCDYEVRI